MYAFLSVVVLAIAGLVAFRWHLKTRPDCSASDFEALRLVLANHARVLSTLANKLGLQAKIS